MSGSTAQLARAKMEVEQAKKRLATTMGALQYRLRPGTIANNAWEGVREKSGEMADDAIQAVKDRPATASGIVAGLVIFFARDPLWRFASGFFLNEEKDEGTIQAHLEEQDGNFDLTAPTVTRSLNEGVNA